MKAKRAIIEEALRATAANFAHLPVADAFLAQFASIKSRYKTLVLRGRSGTGKTSYARSLTGNPAEVFEVNCANCPEPEIRGFLYRVRNIISFDEATPSMVLAQKKLFQSPP